MGPGFRVSVCGGGIGGLMLALVIGKYSSLSVEIFEAGPTITSFGAGVSFFGRTLDIMNELGLCDEFVAASIRPPQEDTGPIIRKSDQQDGFHWFTIKSKREDMFVLFTKARVMASSTGGLLSFHRKDLIDFLLRHVSTSCRIHTSKKLEFYDVNSNTREITMHFTDCSTATTDVLVGADGIRSATRKTLFQNLASSIQNEDSRKKLLECVNPIWTGTLIYRNLVPTAKFLKEFSGVDAPPDFTLHLGKNKLVVAYPIREGQLVNVALFCQNPGAFGAPFEGRWVMDVSENEVLDQFEDWDIHARALAKCVERPSRWALHVLNPLPHYVDGNVALLGDAAHAMEPYLGAGAGQAIEDAFVLGRLLTHELTHRGNVEDALKTYEEVRLPFANNVAQRSQDVGRYYGLHVSMNGAMLGCDCQEDLDYVRKSIEDAWKWQNEPALLWHETEERWQIKCSMHV